MSCVCRRQMLHTCIAYSTQQLDGRLFDTKIVAQRYLNNRKEISREVVSFLHLTRVQLHVLLS